MDNNNLIENYVKSKGGKKVIEKILIANNGIAAVKAIRSVRKWAYSTFGNERIIKFVVMATPEDLKANAEYIRMADQILEVPGGTNNNNYANVDIIVDFAERAGVQAVWAGWGHASENPRLPEQLSNTATGIVFIGPPSNAMQDLGDKIASTIVAQSANVQCVPWSGTGLTVDYNKEGCIPNDTYRLATIATLEEAKECANKVGFPAMIKASEGGGGKGIRKVTGMDDLAQAFRQVQSEVPGSPIFYMKLVSNARHLEVQIIADQYNQAISLNGRDCSVQRRHQKIIEEGPAIAPTPQVWLEMEKAAVRLVKEVGYVGAGTVEYLFDGETYYFLELNPRLQVEHPVTEGITNVNLPATQLQIAMGIPLYMIPDIRKYYNQDVNSDSEYDLNDFSKRIEPRGHVIAVRITGENPDEGFKPTSGLINELTFRSTPNVWGYFSVSTKGGLHEYADSQFGHIFASGINREEARKAMVLGLKEISIRGDIRTPVEYIIHLLEMEDFKENRIHTGWLDQLITQKVKTLKPDNNVVVVCGSIFKAHSIYLSRMDEFSHQVNCGQLPSLELLQIQVPVELIYNNIKYQFEVSRSGTNSYLVSLRYDKSNIIEATVASLSDGGLLIMLDSKTHVCYGREDVTGTTLIIDSKTCVFNQEYDPSILRTSSPGKLVRYLVDDGSEVTKGIPYAEIEVMKMYMSLLVPENGIIKFALNEGSVMSAGAIIANLQLGDSTSIQKSTLFDGKLPKMSAPTLIGTKPHQILNHTLNGIKAILLGYDTSDLQRLVDDLFRQIQNRDLPYHELREALSIIQSRIPKNLVEIIQKELEDYKLQQVSFNGKNLLCVIGLYLNKLLLENETASIHLQTVVKPVMDLCEKYHDGIQTSSGLVIKTFLEEFLSIETMVQNRNLQTVLKQVRQSCKDNMQRILYIAQSLHPQSKRYKLILVLLEKILDQSLVTEYLDILKKISLLTGTAMEISLKAKQIIVKSQLPSSKQRINELEQQLEEILNCKEQEERNNMILTLARQANEITDILIPYFSTPRYASLAMELYVRHSYRSYYVENCRFSHNNNNIISSSVNNNFDFIEWHFYISLPNTSPPYSPINNSNGNGFQSLRGSSMSIMNGLQSMFRTDSTDSLQAIEDHTKLRYGMMVHFDNEMKFQENLPNILKSYNSPDDDFNKSSPLSTNLSIRSSSSQNNTMNSGESTDILSVVLNIYPDSISEETKIINNINIILKSYYKELSQCRIRRITLICNGQIGKPLKFFTFRERHLYNEDPIFRHIEPAMAYHLEVRKLSNFDISHIPTQSQRIHLYYAQEKGKRETDPDADRCFFVRSVIRYSDILGASDIKVDILLSQIETILSESIESLELALVNKKYERAQNHSIFVNILPEVLFDERMIGYVVQEIGDRVGKKLWKIRVGRVEVKGRIRRENTLIPVRFFIQNPTGYAFQVQCYYEQMNAIGQNVFAVVPGSSRGIWEGLPVDSPYPIMDAVQRNRFKAQRLDTTYVYDFPDLFREALQNNWLEYMDQHKTNPNRSQPPSSVLDFVELILSPNCSNKTDFPPKVPFDQLPQDQRPTLEETYRPSGYNDIGMVAWRMTFYTPEYPKGRPVIVIANDITHQIGSFGPQEDLLFKLSSELARIEGIPRIYLSSNSGARIGLAEEIKSKFQVIWNNPQDPTKGIRELYLNAKNYLEFKDYVKAYQDPTNSDRWIITDIIGQKNGIGVENLSWSGLIAGETSKAYEEIFTISLVTGRSIGIGAYLVRLGQRTIQNDAPIILTGASALNKVLGKEVYESNQQLGGVQIMYPNGVSHIAVNDELRGIQSIISWLAFVPRSRGELVPIIIPVDKPEREIDFDPNFTQKYDTRSLLSGTVSPHDPNLFITGFFDKDSFIETLGGWANTVITGRARLGGIPIGVIAVEMKTIEKVIPADPANPLSQEQVLSQAGQVWYPDSSFKTAQAIKDFNKGEELPLIIFANWRGFSGGMRDMFDEILKFGAMIVDNLRDYKQPVFVYLPPGGELRGGAWVVLDSTINLDMMEMYSSESARGGVLEPNGIVEIKYRDPELIRTMHRLDPKLQDLDKEIGLASSINGGLDQNQRNVKLLIQQREKELLGVYQQLAIKFTDLHDTPGRMKAKGVIHEIIPWKQSRKFFYYRLKRRLYEEQQLKLIDKVHPNLNRKSRLDLLNAWIVEINNNSLGINSNTVLNGISNLGINDNNNNILLKNNNNNNVLDSDEFVSNFLIKNFNLLSDKTNELTRSYIQNQIIQFAETDSESTIDAFELLFNNLTNEQKKTLLSKMSSNLNNNNFDLE